jgi:hypothetical protein
MKHLLAMAHSNKHFHKLRHLQHKAVHHAQHLHGKVHTKLAHAKHHLGHMQHHVKHIAHHAHAMGGAAMKKEGGGRHALKFKM